MAVGKYFSGKQALNLYESAYQAFNELDDLELILNINNNQIYDLYKTKNSSKNIFVTNKIPQLEVLKKASVFITHGGFSSFREVIYCATPMIVFPIGIDQPGIAARVEFLKIGIRKDIKTVTRNLILDAVEEINKNDNYSNSIKNMQDYVLKNNNCDNGVNFIKIFFKNKMN